MNLVEFPFATLSHKPSLGSIKCRRWFTAANGERYEQRWVVQGGSESGLPTEFDERVYVALMALTKRQGFVARKVPFSVYQVLQIMGETTDNRHYQSIERSLERLLRASIVAEGSFWDAAKKELVHRLNGFHLIERFWLAYQEKNQAIVEREGVPGYIVWGEEIWQSLVAGYLKQLDLDLFFSLQTPIARRLYRFLDKKLHRSGRYELDVFQLAEQLGMAHYAYPAKVKEKLQPGLDELVAQGFLESATLVRVQGYTRVRFVRNRKARASPTVSPPMAVASRPEPQRPVERGDEGRAWRRQTAREHGVADGYLRLWEQILQQVRPQVSLFQYSAWLARTLLLNLDREQATILVRNAYAQEQVAQRLEDPLREALSAALQSRVTLSYRYEAPPAIPQAAVPATPDSASGH